MTPEAALERALSSRDDLISIKVWDLESALVWTSLGSERIDERFEPRGDPASRRSRVEAHPTPSRVQSPTGVDRGVAAIPTAPGELPEGFTVLMAEDNASLRRVLERALRDRGLTVLSCVDGQEAVRSAREYRGRIDALVTDLVMPHVSGPETAEQIRSLIPGIGVVFISGYRYDSAVADYEENGNLFLQKPFRIDDLVRQLGNLPQVDTPDGPHPGSCNPSPSKVMAEAGSAAAEGQDMSAHIRRIAHDLSNTAMVIDSLIRLIKHGQSSSARSRAVTAASDRLYEITTELEALTHAPDPEVTPISELAKTD